MRRDVRMWRQFAEDADVALTRDPAARTRLEVLLTYPGVHALWAHRVAHRWWQRGALLAARLLAAWARRRTGIEIHPGAQVGRRVFIDHGMGVVVGETAVIGDDVTLFHGVTLGGTRTQAGRRHPQVGNRVTIGAGATVLGPIAIGDDARIGAGAVVLSDVAGGTTAVGIPARAIGESREPAVIPAPDPAVSHTTQGHNNASHIKQPGGEQWEVEPAAWI